MNDDEVRLEPIEIGYDTQRDGETYATRKMSTDSFEPLEVSHGNCVHHHVYYVYREMIRGTRLIYVTNGSLILTGYV